MHFVHRAGLPGDCLYPACLKMRPPSPANGAAHSLQRGADGIRRNARRCPAKPGLSPVSTARTCSGVGPSGAILFNLTYALPMLNVPMTSVLLALPSSSCNSTVEPRGSGTDHGAAPAPVIGSCERVGNLRRPRPHARWFCYRLSDARRLSTQTAPEDRPLGVPDRRPPDGQGGRRRTWSVAVVRCELGATP
jgi:hypothetical protein